MNQTLTVPAELEESPLVASLQALHALYDEVEEACTGFADRARAVLAERGEPNRFGCPQGCGACCERFVPDLLPLEADYAAVWILKHRPDLAGREAPEGPACPYYDIDNREAHCQIYGGRPLICRLFGYTALSGREGLPSFALCWKMPSLASSTGRAWEGRELAETFGTLPTLMSPFGFRLEALSPPARHPRPRIGQAVQDSIGRLRLLMSFSRADLPA